MREANEKKLREAIEKAAEIMWRREKALPPHAPNAPGNVYVFDHNTDIALVITVVRTHPDDNSVVLVVPCDDCSTFVGTADEDLSELMEYPFVARCGECIWLPADQLSSFTYVDTVNQTGLSNIKVKIHELATGKDTAQRPEVDCDPEYEYHMQEIATAINSRKEGS